MGRTSAPAFMTRNPNFEVQLKHNFIVYIEGLSDECSFMLQSFPIPTINVAEEEIAWGNQSMYVAGKATVDGGSVVFNDYLSVDTENILYQWFKKVYDTETGVRGRQADYKKTAIVQILDGTMENDARSWKIEGIWPQSFESGELSYDDATKRQVTMTLKFDNAYPIDR